VREYAANGAVNWTTRVSFSSWFGTTGWATASAVSVLDDGSILVAGDIWNGTAYRFAMLA